MQNEQEKYIEIDLMQLLTAIWRKLWIVVLAAVFTAAAVFGFTYFAITPVYQAESMLYVNNNKSAADSQTISAADLTAAQSLTETFTVVLNSRAVLEETAKQAGFKESIKQLSSMITSSSVNETEMIRITVSSTDPKEAAELANAAATVSSAKMMETVEGSSVKVIDSAVMPEEPSSPDYMKNTVIGFLLGLLISIAVIVLMDLKDTSIRSDSQLSDMFEDIPVLAVIPLPNGKAGKKRSDRYGYYQSADSTGKTDDKR